MRSLSIEHSYNNLTAASLRGSTTPADALIQCSDVDKIALLSKILIDFSLAHQC